MNTYPYNPPSWLARLGLALIFTLTLIAAVALSAVFFALFVVLALAGGGWLWWQRWRLSRRMRSAHGDIIEVEYEVVEEDYRLDHVQKDPGNPKPWDSRQ